MSYVYYSFSLVNNNNNNNNNNNKTIDDNNTDASESAMIESDSNSSHTIYYCSCDYCTNIDLTKSSNIDILNRIKNYNKLVSSAIQINHETKNSKSIEPVKTQMSSPNVIDRKSVENLRTKSKSTSSLMRSKEEISSKDQVACPQFCDHFFNMWKSEAFKSKALEKQNEKLENRVKYLEAKVEKETHQQIKISLEWRKTVTNLVDENVHLKQQLALLAQSTNANKQTSLNASCCSASAKSSHDSSYSPIVIKSLISSSSFTPS
jgi:hypothetical protein